ncbi:uncharacterized protein LOC126380929 [Pectinophora gossypiella]|nr:uncharacterized protein LOC126380929 [Pectinophora gossypiella]
MTTSSEDITYMFEQHAQDPLANFDEDYPELARLHREPKKRKPAKRNVSVQCVSKKIRHKDTSSFVLQNHHTPGTRLIRVQVVDLENSPQVTHDNGDPEENILMSAQYVVHKDSYDEVLTQTEALIANISKKLCNYHF